MALRLAQAGANVTIAAKTYVSYLLCYLRIAEYSSVVADSSFDGRATAHPKLPGTVYTAAADIEKAGGKALPLVVDIRHAEQIEEAMEKTVERFGGIDIVINNVGMLLLGNPGS